MLVQGNWVVMEDPEKPRKGRIPEELQQQAKKAESPIVSEFLVAARKGFTQHVIQSLTEGGSAKAAVIDKVISTYIQCSKLKGSLYTQL